MPGPIAEIGQRMQLADTLSSLLGSIQLRAFVAPEAAFLAPWSVGFPAGPLSFHVVTKGNALLVAKSGSAFELGKGDIVLATDGTEHRLCCDETLEPTSILELVTAEQVARREPIVHGGLGTATRVVSGFFVHRDRGADRLFASLPPFVVVRNPGDGWVESMLHLVALETGHDVPAVHDLLNHLGCALLGHILRLHLREHPALSDSWLERARRRDVAAAVSAINVRPEAPWTVAGLAKLAGLSRSSFAAQFLAAMGMPPVRYLFERRMEIAAALLKQPQATIKEIAARCGYATEAAFTNAFRRWAGIPPGAFRTREREVSPVLGPSGRVRPAGRD
jgi:AraC-like DNA-binding protein